MVLAGPGVGTGVVDGDPVETEGDGHVGVGVVEQACTEVAGHLPSRTHLLPRVRAYVEGPCLASLVAVDDATGAVVESAGE